MPEKTLNAKKITAIIKVTIYRELPRHQSLLKSLKCTLVHSMLAITP